ncbi:MAG: formate--tetrahydrofolate ligase, partial [Spirochaetota bacterium]
SNSIADLKERLGRIIVADTRDGKPVSAADIKVHGAMAALLKDALKPNLVQTLENTPAIIHGGPFANIAHGCNSIVATKMAMALSDYVVTEAGFGADLGAEKFLDIKCRYGGLKPDCVVLVATVRALKMHGGMAKTNLKKENLDALSKGMENLEKHLENIDKFNLPVVVAINRFPDDTAAELKVISDFCTEKKVEFSLSEVWEKGGEGGEDLAQKVAAIVDSNRDNNFQYLYELDLSIKDKIETIATELYGADGVTYSGAALKKIDGFISKGYGKLPVCIAKTQASLSDDPLLVGRPRGYNVTVRDVTLSAGAGFLVVHTGEIMTMPGLPKRPAAQDIDVDDNGVITGLF